MFANRPPSRWSSLENQHSRNNSDARDQVHRLVKLGLVDAQPRANVKKKRGIEINLTESQFYNPKTGPSNSASSIEQSHGTDRGGRLRKDNHSRLSSIAQLKERRNSMFISKPRAVRRERTFVGDQCAACEEPLEHILRGERILQLSCGHVSHEACFYEYIKEFEAHECPTCNAPLGLDTSRGGNIDFANLSKLVKSAQGADSSERARELQATPAPWDSDDVVTAQPESRQATRHVVREHLLPEEAQPGTYQHERRPSEQPSEHLRKKSVDTGKSSGNAADPHHAPGRRHDYDVYCMETALSNQPQQTRNSVPSPKITVRSEFPTLNKSRQQQSLTCLVTVEVVDQKRSPNLEPVQNAPPVPAIPDKFDEFPRPPLKSPPKPPAPKPVDSVHEDLARLGDVKDELYRRCENWHGLDFQRFGRLLLHGNMRVSKDRQAWQDLECYLFTEMLICVKARKATFHAPTADNSVDGEKQISKVALKGSILIKKHLNQVEVVPDSQILMLSLSVPELPRFYLQFNQHSLLETWRQKLLYINQAEIQERSLPPVAESEEEDFDTEDEDDEATIGSPKVGPRLSSLKSSTNGGARSHTTAPTEYTHSHFTTNDMRLSSSDVHVPVDIVVVIPVSCSIQGLKLNVLRDSLHFLVSSLRSKDRMGLVTFGAGGNSVPLVGMASKTWPGWSQVIDSIRPTGQKNIRADVVDGANVAMDLLMQRKASNPLATIMVISDAATSDHDSIDFVVSRAEAAKVTIHSFGLGLTHKPDMLVELSTKTKANYTYVKDWMMLRECLAGCIGALQSTSHQNVKLKLRLPGGAPAKFVKISGALQVTKRATGRDAEVSLGDLRFGDKRDILVQLAILPDASTPDEVPQDQWDNIVSGLEALSGMADQDESRPLSVEELPILQADLSWSDVLRNGHVAHLSRPSLLAITMLPTSKKRSIQTPPATPPIPPHPSIVQRRMELLTSDMLSRALTLVSRGQAERAHHLLAETRSILKGLNKGNLPPIPPQPNTTTPHPSRSGDRENLSELNMPLPEESNASPSPPRKDPLSPFSPATGIDSATVAALDSELESSLEYISHPAFFVRDSRKAVLQAIGVISSQRAYTFRTGVEALWASRVSGIRRLSESNRDWRETGYDCLAEEEAA